MKIFTDILLIFGPIYQPPRTNNKEIKDMREKMIFYASVVRMRFRRRIKRLHREEKKAECNWSKMKMKGKNTWAFIVDDKPGS